MEKNKKKSSTADLLTWSEDDAAVVDSTETLRSHQVQPSDEISKVVFGGQLTDQELQTLHKIRKPVSGYKLKEITGSSNISFGGQESLSPKKPLSEAKQRELSGTLGYDSDSKLKKQISSAKNKELTGHYNIFAPPPEIQPRPLAAPVLALRETISIGQSAPNHTDVDEPLKTAKKIPSQKFTDLSGNNIFKDDETPLSAEKPLSSAKLREMSGSNIFADRKVESRECLGGVRKPPGGESSIALV